jgi:ABC-type amino acid transport system permease subunit
VTGFYVDFMRATPLLLQLIYIYFVLPTFGIRPDPFVAGVVGLSLNYTAYLSEVYRSGIQAIPRGQLDAAAALGMRPSLTMRRIVLPQAIRIVIPPLGNYFVALFKDTSLVSALTLQELLFSGQIIISRTYDYFTIYTMVFFFYFLVSYPALIFVRHLEKLMKAGYRRRLSPESLLLPIEPT